MLVCGYMGEKIGLVGGRIEGAGVFEVDPDAKDAVLLGGERATTLDVAAVYARAQGEGWAGRWRAGTRARSLYPSPHASRDAEAGGCSSSFIGARARRARRGGGRENAIWLAHSARSRRRAKGPSRRSGLRERREAARVGRRRERFRARRVGARAGAREASRAWRCVRAARARRAQRGARGARLGEGAGRSLLLMSDEVRAHVARGGESARELTATLGDIGADVNSSTSWIRSVRGATDASHEAARVGARGHRGRSRDRRAEQPARAGDRSDPVTALVAERGARARRSRRRSGRWAPPRHRGW